MLHSWCLYIIGWPKLGVLTLWRRSWSMSFCLFRHAGACTLPIFLSRCSVPRFLGCLWRHYIFFLWGSYTIDYHCDVFLLLLFHLILWMLVFLGSCIFWSFHLTRGYRCHFLTRIRTETWFFYPWNFCVVLRWALMTLSSYIFGLSLTATRTSDYFFN